jgi:hypothetical protein
LRRLVYIEHSNFCGMLTCLQPVERETRLLIVNV